MENNFNTDKRGPDKVEQSKNADEIFDKEDDLPETKTKEELKPEVKLERGEELYKGFGFDEDDNPGEKPIPERLDAESIDIKRIENLVESRDREKRENMNKDIEDKKDMKEKPIDIDDDKDISTTTEKIDIPLGAGVTLGTDKVDEDDYFEVEEEIEIDIIALPKSDEKDQKAIPADVDDSRASLYPQSSLYDGSDVVNSDYELSEVYYIRKNPEDRNISYNEKLLRENDIQLDVIPIKKQYKMMKPKKGISKMLLIGAAAVAVGIGLYLTNHDDD